MVETAPDSGSSQEPAIAFSRPALGAEEARAAADAVNSGWIVGGPRLAAFETSIATLCHVEAAIGVSSWTTGAFLVLYAWGIGVGDEVIVPSLSFIASVNAVRHCGATPVFVDVERDTLNIDVADAASKVTARTRAIMPVDQLGLPCAIDDVNALARRHGLRVLDDAACALGSRNAGRPVGSLADATVFSLHARKVVTTGEGGVITTDDPAFAERLRRLRHQGMSLSDFARHGARPTVFETYPEIGFNYRMTDIQAAIGVVQMNRLPELLARRKVIAQAYEAAFDNHPFIRPPRVAAALEPNWQSYQVFVGEEAPFSRNEIMDRLYDAGVPTRRGVMASHQEAPYAAMASSLPNTEILAAQGLQLPMHPGLTETQVARVIEAVWALVR